MLGDSLHLLWAPPLTSIEVIRAIVLGNSVHLLWAPPTHLDQSGARADKRVQHGRLRTRNHPACHCQRWPHRPHPLHQLAAQRQARGSMACTGACGASAGRGEAPHGAGQQLQQLCDRGRVHHSLAGVKVVGVRLVLPCRARRAARIGGGRSESVIEASGGEPRGWTACSCAPAPRHCASSAEPS